MKYIVQITGSGPLSFRAGRETTAAKTLPYVPGTTLLGGLAAAHNQLRGDASEFNAFFMSDESSFGNLYPASFKLDDPRDDTAPVYPLPATARSCKRFGGFKFDEKDPDDPHHGVFDALIPWALFALSGQTRPDVLAGVKDCPVCENPKNPLDRFDGFYRRDPFDAQAMGTVKARPALRTRTGINHATGTVQQAILYSREVLQDTEFWGTLTVPDVCADAFDAFVQQGNSSGLLRLGNNRTRGFGKVTLGLAQMQEDDATQSLQSRIQAFDAELRQQAQSYHIETRHELYLPLTLTSDAILFDKLLRCQTVIQPEYLAETWGITDAELIYQNSGTRRVMGWNDLWRLPKPDDIAITKGSVFLFGLRKPIDQDRIRALSRMQDEGIGARRREGFGRLLVASPFHWEVKGQ